MASSNTYWCDVCNKGRERKPDGRGYVDDVSIPYLTSAFGWQVKRGKHVCDKCVEEEQSRDEAKEAK